MISIQPRLKPVLYALGFLSLFVSFGCNKEDNFPSDLDSFGGIPGCEITLKGTYNDTPLEGTADYSIEGPWADGQYKPSITFKNYAQDYPTSRYVVWLLFDPALYDTLSPMSFTEFISPRVTERGTLGSGYERLGEGIQPHQMVARMIRFTGGADTAPSPRYTVRAWSQNKLTIDSVVLKSDDMDALGSYITGTFSLRFELLNTESNLEQADWARRIGETIPPVLTFENCSFKAYRKRPLFLPGECPY